MMPVARKARTADTYNLEARLEAIIDIHLRDMEEHPNLYGAKDRLSTIQYVGMFLNRKYGWGEPEAEGVGSAVRRYAGAFQVAKSSDAARPRTASARPNRVSGSLALADTSDPEPDEDAAA